MNVYCIEYEKYKKYENDVRLTYDYVVAISYEQAIKIFKLTNNFEIISISKINNTDVLQSVDEKLDIKIKPKDVEIFHSRNAFDDSIKTRFNVLLSLTEEEVKFLSKYIDFEGYYENS